MWESHIRIRIVCEIITYSILAPTSVPITLTVFACLKLSTFDVYIAEVITWLYYLIILYRYIVGINFTGKSGWK